MKKESKIPEASIERIALYSRPLEKLLESRSFVISSEKLAQLCKVNPAQVRKDLSYFGEFGVRGIGYDVTDLLRAIRKILGSDREWRLALLGAGNMGQALIRHEEFLKRGYRFVAVFDSSHGKIGKTLSSTSLVIQPMSMLGLLVESLEIEVGLIATPPSEAQHTADRLVEAGVKAILNFSPIQLRQPDNILVENVDFTVNLDNLAYFLKERL
jgi:redox-sensing transcriptional repressor